MAWWNQYPKTHGYISSYQGPNTDTPHYALDIGTPFHTPITALLPGTVKVADFPVWGGQPGGGEVFVQPDQGGPEYYLYHLDTENVHAGQHVNAGDMLGLSGGQNQGGYHPVGQMWSTGPHTHVGYFTGFINTPAGSRPYGPDISNLFLSLGQNQTTTTQSGQPTYLGTSGSGWNLGTTNQSSNNNNSGLCQNWWDWIINPKDCGQAVGQQASDQATSSFAAGLQAIFTTDRIYRIIFIVAGIALIWVGWKRLVGGSPATNINLSGLLPQTSEESGNDESDSDFAASRKNAEKVAKKATATPKAATPKAKKKIAPAAPKAAQPVEEAAQPVEDVAEVA